MPKIKTVTAQVQSAGANRFQQRSRASDFGGGQGLQQAGQALGQFGDVLQQRAEQAELSGVSKALSTGRAQHTQFMIDSAQTMEAGGSGFTEDFTGTLNDWGTKTRENFKTPRAQQAWDEGFASMQGDLTTRAFGVQAKAYAAKQRTDFTAGLNDDGLTLQTDPTQFESVLKLRHEAVDALPLSADIKAELHTQADTELTVSAVRGEIRQNPERAQALLEAGRFNDTIDKDDVKSLMSEAKAAERANKVDAQLAKTRAEDAVKAERMVTMNGFLNRMAPGAEEPLTNNDILASSLTPAQKVTYQGLLKNSTKGTAITTDSEVFLDTFNRINLSDGDPRKITNEEDLNALVGKGLTMDNLNTLRTEIQGGRTAEGKMTKELKDGLTRVAKSALTATDPLLGLRDPKGDEQYQRYISWMLPEYLRQIDEGVSSQELLDPDSKHYLGKGIDQFKRSKEQMMRDLFNSGNSIEPPNAGSDVGATAGLEEIDVSSASNFAKAEDGTLYYEIAGKGWVDKFGREYKP